MQLSSMTGFARNKADFVFQNKKYDWVWEIKSVNAKNADVKIRLPQWLDMLETDVKNICMRVFSRGTFNVNLMLEVENTNPALKVDEGLLASLVDEAHNIYNTLPDFFAKPSPVEFLKINGVVKAAENMPDDEETAALGKVLCQSFEKTALALKESRRQEGAKIGQALQMILAQIRENVSAVREISKKSPEKIKEKICRQIKDMVEDAGISEDRLNQEALLLIMRADVKEELDRLDAHLKTAEELLAENNPVGRRLDFLCQELNREANTLCSKSMDIEQTKHGMALKALIEQFREQVQNVE